MLFRSKPKEYVDINGSCVYETLLFAGNLSYFLDTFTPPLTTEEWISIPMGYTLELSFYERFSHDESKFLIINDHSSSIFSNSDVNLLRYGFYNCEMVYNTPNPERVMLYLMNYALDDSIVKYINIYKNNALLKTLTLFRSGYWFTDFEIDGSEIVVEAYVDENKKTLESSKKFVLNQELLVNCLQVGKFELV